MGIVWLVWLTGSLLLDIFLKRWLMIGLKVVVLIWVVLYAGGVLPRWRGTYRRTADMNGWRL